MLKVISFVQSRMGRLAREESAQDGFEYLLVIGVVSVGVIAAIVGLPGLVASVIAGVTAAIKALPGMSAV